MKHYLIVKMSSLGDVVHLLPALTDACQHDPSLKFDWVVEKGFAEIARWHPAIDKVIPVQLRQWRKAPWQAFRSGAWQSFQTELRCREYAGVLDAQGLFKSSCIALFAKGRRYGLDRKSARGGWSSLLYHHKVEVSQQQHAVARQRALFSKIFNYPTPTNLPDFGIEIGKLKAVEVAEHYYVFLHGTTWTTKHWPVTYWIDLARLVTKAGYVVYLPWGTEIELERAKAIAIAAGPLVQVLPRLSLAEVTYVIAKAKGVVAVDTGLGHIAAALAVPVLSLYGPTDPGLTGAYGPKSQHFASSLSCAPCFKRECTRKEPGPIQPPCFASLNPTQVWTKLQYMVLNETT